MLSFLCMVLLAQASMVSSEEFVPGKKDYGCEMGLFKNGDFTCAAIILGTNYGITAAHCVTDKTATYTVEAGHGKEKRTLNIITIADDFIDNEEGLYMNDIAYIAWEEAIEEVEGLIRYIPLIRVITKDTCWVTGYGENPKKHVQVDVLSGKDCVEDTFFKQKVCVRRTDKAEKAECKGALGSPLICKNPFGTWKVGGIASFGAPLCDGSKPSVFTKPATFHHWLMRQESFRTGVLTGGISNFYYNYLKRE